MANELSNEPYILSKEPDMLSKEPYILSEELCFFEKCQISVESQLALKREEPEGVCVDSCGGCDPAFDLNE